MKLGLLLILLGFFSVVAVAETQHRLNQVACDSVARVERALAADIQAIQQRHQGDALFLEKLAQSQNAWLAYREAQLALQFPLGNDTQAYGSIYPLCACQLLEKLTQARIDSLQPWLTKTQEGDPCVGSQRL